MAPIHFYGSVHLSKLIAYPVLFIAVALYSFSIADFHFLSSFKRKYGSITIFFFLELTRFGFLPRINNNTKMFVVYFFRISPQHT